VSHHEKIHCTYQPRRVQEFFADAAELCGDADLAFVLRRLPDDDTAMLRLREAVRGRRDVPDSGTILFLRTFAGVASTVQGVAVRIVLLVRLEEAAAAGDPILAVG